MTSLRCLRFVVPGRGAGLPSGSAAKREWANEARRRGVPVFTAADPAVFKAPFPAGNSDFLQAVRLHVTLTGEILKPRVGVLFQAKCCGNVRRFYIWWRGANGGALRKKNHQSAKELFFSQ